MEENRRRKRRNGERKKERKEDPAASSSDFLHSDCWISSSRELKSVYTSRATLQEVGIFLLWLIAFLFGPVFKDTS